MKFTKHILLYAFILVSSQFLSAQETFSDKEAVELMSKLSKKYKSFESFFAQLSLSVIQPKMKPSDDEAKLTQTFNGNISVKGDMFTIDLPNQKIWCDGKTIWTLLEKEKEVQINDYEESTEMFNPSKIFTFYNQGYLFRTKEKRKVNGKAQIIVELTPSNKKYSFFKIELTVSDEADPSILEAKIFEKSGIKYLYKVIKFDPNIKKSINDFTFEPKKYPGVKVVDIR